MKSRKFLIAGTFLFLFLLLPLSLFSVSLYRLTKKAREAKNLIQSGRILEVEKTLQSSKKDLRVASYSLIPLSWLRIVPRLSNEVKITSQVLKVSLEVIDLLEEAFILTKKVLEIEPHSQLDSLSIEKGKIIVNLSLHKEELKQIEEKAENLQNKFLQIDFSKSPRLIKEKGILLGEKINQILRGLQELRFASETLPAFIGYPDERTYLFVFQNNTELRPSGGFLGTYGILKLKDGEIIEFFTDDTYNLDKKVEFDNSFQIAPPKPLQIYNKDKKWTFRDSNWSPDFPQAAQKMLEFYKLEKGKDAEKLDGVIAITPTLVEDLLEIVGPIKVEGYPYQFTAENFTDELEAHVEKNYVKLNEEKKERKSIIGKMGEILISEILNLPSKEIIKVLQVVERNLREKQIFIYSLDPEEEKHILRYNWGGEIKKKGDNKGDFLMVVDANIGSLKSDPKVERVIEYDNSEGEAYLKITYNHRGQFDWKTTRYRTWVRIYVPQGSELISLKGNKSSIGTSQDLGKTVFSFFKSIEPQTQESVIIKYKLPSTIDLKNYSLYIQKQAGTINHKLKVKIDTGVKKIEWEGDLKEDRSF